MAHLDLHEQEQMSAIKYFLRDWGKYVLVGLAIIIGVYLVDEFINYRATSMAKDAVVVYNEFVDSATNANESEAYTIALKLERDFPKVEYSSFASIWAAKLAKDNHEYSDAQKLLQWVMYNTKDTGLINLARLNLAYVYIDQKKFDIAMSLLQGEHEASFDVLYYQARGDLYVVSGDNAKARDAYKEALNRSGGQADSLQAIQLKIDLLN